MTLKTNHKRNSGGGEEGGVMLLTTAIFFNATNITLKVTQNSLCFLTSLYIPACARTIRTTLTNGITLAQIQTGVY